MGDSGKAVISAFYPVQLRSTQLCLCGIVSGLTEQGLDWELQLRWEDYPLLVSDEAPHSPVRLQASFMALATLFLLSLPPLPYWSSFLPLLANVTIDQSICPSLHLHCGCWVPMETFSHMYRWRPPVLGLHLHLGPQNVPVAHVSLLSSFPCYIVATLDLTKSLPATSPLSFRRLPCFLLTGKTEVLSREN